MMDLTISIGSLGKLDMIRRCLRSVFEEDAPGFCFEVRVVYNGPGGDGVCETIPTEELTTTEMGNSLPITDFLAESRRRQTETTTETTESFGCDGPAAGGMVRQPRIHEA
jgi:hypothetical protein